MAFLGDRGTGCTGLKTDPLTLFAVADTVRTPPLKAALLSGRGLRLCGEINSHSLGLAPKPLK
jgi:hypothetical protein